MLDPRRWLASVSWRQVVVGFLVGTLSVILVDFFKHRTVTGPPVVDLTLRVIGMEPSETGILLAVESTFRKRRICPAYITWFAEPVELFRINGHHGIPFRFPLTVPYPASVDVGDDSRLTVLWLNLPPGDYRAFPTGIYVCEDGNFPIMGIDGAPSEPIRFAIQRQDGKLVCILQDRPPRGNLDR